LEDIQISDSTSQHLQGLFLDFAEIFKRTFQQSCINIFPFGKYVIKALKKSDKRMDVWIQYYTTSKPRNYHKLFFTLSQERFFSVDVFCETLRQKLIQKLKATRIYISKSSLKKLDLLEIESSEGKALEALTCTE